MVQSIKMIYKAYLFLFLAFVLPSCSQSIPLTDVNSDQLNEFLGSHYKHAKITAIQNQKVCVILLAKQKVIEIQSFSDVGKFDNLSRPWFSPDGNNVLISYQGQALISKDYQKFKPIMNDLKVYQPSYWWDEIHSNLCIVYKNHEEKHRFPDHKKYGNTYLYNLETKTNEMIADFPCDGGLSKDGTHLGEAYRGCLIYSRHEKKYYELYGYQSCSASMSPDNTYRIMHLYRTHLAFGIRNKNDQELWKMKPPAPGNRWQDPRWSNHPDFCTALIKVDGVYYICLVQISTQKTLILTQYGSGWHEPQLWLNLE